MESAEAENVQLHREVAELRDVLEAHHLEAKSAKCYGLRKLQASGLGDLGGANLAQELMDVKRRSSWTQDEEAPKKSVQMAEEAEPASAFKENAWNNMGKEWKRHAFHPF